MGLRYLGNIIRPGYDPLASNITTGVNTAQHQGVFTLQQQAQAQSTQSWITEPLFESNTLLLQADNTTNGLQNGAFLDSSANNFSITRNGDATQGTFSPYSAQPGAWGIYFNGSNSYVATTITSSQFSFGSSGNFTVELWAYLDGSQGTFAGLINNMSGYSTGGQYSNRWGLNLSGTTLRWDDSAGGVGCTTTLPTYTWIHIAVARVGSTITLYINGVSVATQTANQAYTSDYLVNIGYLPGQAYFKGYISNVRIVKGTAVYTTNFTPPTTPLTNVTNTSLLTCQSNSFVDNGTGNSGNPFALTVGGTPSIQPFSPINLQNQWAPNIVGGSAYFDGTGDNIQTTGANANLSIGTGDFTLECWVYLLSASGDPGIMQLAGSAFGTNAPTYTNSVGVIATTGAGLWALINNGSYTNGSISRALNAWTHLAISRSGTTTRLFVNGVQAVSVSDSSNYTTQYFAAGCAYGTNFPSNSYISNIRLVRGTAVYTGAFTPPTRSLSASGADSASAYPSTTNVNTSFAASATSLLINSTNAGIYDGAMKNNLSLFGNTQVSTSIKRYGSGSIFFDGSGDYLTLPNAPQTIGVISPTTNLTIEGWIYHTQRPAFAESGLIGDMAPTAGTNYWSFGPNQNGYLVWYSFSNATQTATSTQIPLNTWTHIAVSIQNGTIRQFVNGVLQAFTGNAALTTTSSSIGYITMGQWNNSSNYAYFGYVDDFRITRAARYITSFTPPRVALPRQ